MGLDVPGIRQEAVVRDMNMTNPKIREPKTGVVIVAAGLSSRMKAFKPMLPLAGSTVIRALIDTMKKANIEPIIVVVGKNSQELIEHLSDLPVETVVNSDYAKTDMFFFRLFGVCQDKRAMQTTVFLPQVIYRLFPIRVLIR